MDPSISDLCSRQFRDPAFIIFIAVYFTHHSVFCPAGPEPPPKRVIHEVQYKASPFNFQYLLVSLSSSSSCLLPFFVFSSLLFFRLSFNNVFKRQFAM